VLGQAAVSFKSFEDQVGVSEDTLRQKFWSMIERICDVMEEQYVKMPSAFEMQKIEAKYAAVGFPGCVGCIDVLHVLGQDAQLPSMDRLRVKRAFLLSLLKLPVVACCEHIMCSQKEQVQKMV